MKHSKIPATNFEYFINQAQVPFAILSGSDLTFTFANPAYVQLMNGRQLEGKTLLEAIPEIAGQPFYELLQKVFHTGTPFHASEIPATASFNGDQHETTRYFNLSYTPYENEHGETEGVLASGYDITAQVLLRKKAEQAKLNLSAYNLFMQAPYAICIYRGHDLEIELANEAALQMTGADSSIIGKRLIEVFPAADEQGFVKILRQVMERDKRYEADEVPLTLTVNGSEKRCYINVICQPFLGEVDAIPGVLVTSNDVTEQVLARKKIEVSEQRFRNVVEQAPDPILIFKGKDMVLEVANEPLLNLWQVGRDAIGKRFLEILPEMKNQGFMDMLLDVYENGKTVYGYETPAVFDRGGEKQTIYVDFVYQPYRENDGSISGVIVIAAEVTEQVIVRQKLAESEERSRLAIDVAELGTWDYVVSTNKVICSPRTKELFGFDQEVVSLEAVFELIAEEHKETVAAAIKNALDAANGNYDIEYALIDARDKTRKTVRAKGKAYFEGGQPVRFVGIVLDISREARAKEEQRKLLSLIDNSAHLMSILSPDQKNTYINKAGLEMLGIKDLPDALSIPISSMHSSADLEFVQKTVLPAIIDTGRWSGVMNVRHFTTGEVFPVYNNSIRIDDPHTGKMLAIGAVMRDMRPELAAQNALIESERNFRNLVKQAPVGICILKDEDLVVEIANQTYLDIVGKHQEDFIGRELLDALPEIKDQGFEQVLKKVLHTGASFHGKELPANLLRNGELETRYVDFVYEPVKEDDGSIRRVMVVAIDVTDQVNARHQIEFAEERARLAIQSAGLGTFDVNLVVNEANNSPRCDEIFGVEHGTDRARYISALHPDDLPQWEEAYQSAFRNGIFQYEARVVRKNNEIRWIKSNGVVFFDENKKPLRLHGVIQDITDQKLFSEELARQVAERTDELNAANLLLQKTNTELEQYAHVSSHDLQEPLRKILMFSEMIKEKDYENLSEASKVRFDKIMEAVGRMSTSLKDLLNFASLAKEEPFVPVDLNEVMLSVESDLELLITQKKATIDYANLPVLNAIPLQMHQLMYNLVNNGLKFSQADQPPEIVISASPLSGEGRTKFSRIDAGKQYVEIIVKDNGIGFDQAYSDKIFTMFQRLNNRQMYSGTGIGLALCKKVAVNHHGDIYAVSAPGKGAAFHIALPLAL